MNFLLHIEHANGRGSDLWTVICRVKFDDDENVFAGRHFEHLYNLFFCRLFRFPVDTLNKSARSVLFPSLIFFVCDGVSMRLLFAAFVMAYRPNAIYRS